jgi:hypothetical protein
VDVGGEDGEVAVGCDGLDELREIGDWGEEGVQHREMVLEVWFIEGMRGRVLLLNFHN